MKLSQRNISFHKDNNNNSKRQINKPKDIVTRLKNDIQSMQSAIKSFNQTDRNSITWRKQLNMPVNSCQLKTLTQPKYQHMLLQSNFIISTNNKQQHKINSSRQEQQQQRLDNNKNLDVIYGSVVRNDSGEKVHKQYRQQQQRRDITKLKNKSQSLYEVVNNNKQSKMMSMMLSSNHSIMLPTHDQIINQSSKTINRKGSIFTICNNDLLDDNNVNNNDLNIKFNPEQSQMIKEISMLRFLPLCQEKNMSAIKGDFASGKNIKTIIEQKTARLQREWVKMQTYRQRFNIMQNYSNTKQQQHALTSRNNKSTTKKSVNKLSSIISKVENRRPLTSISSNQRRNKIYSQQSNHINLNNKSKTINFEDQNLFLGKCQNNDGHNQRFQFFQQYQQ